MENETLNHNTRYPSFEEWRINAVIDGEIIPDHENDFRKAWHARDIEVKELLEALELCAMHIKVLNNPKYNTHQRRDHILEVAEAAIAKSTK